MLLFRPIVQIPPTLVWRRNNVVQTNVTGNGLEFVAIAADSGAKFDVIATVPGGLSTHQFGSYHYGDWNRYRLGGARQTRILEWKKPDRY